MLGNSPPSALKHRSSTLLIAPPRLVTRVFSVPLPFQINCEISRSIAVAIDVDYVTEKKKKKEKEERRPYDTARACKRRETVSTLSFLLLLSVFFFFLFLSLLYVTYRYRCLPPGFALRKFQNLCFIVAGPFLYCRSYFAHGAVRNRRVRPRSLSFRIIYGKRSTTSPNDFCFFATPMRSRKDGR